MFPGEQMKMSEILWGPVMSTWSEEFKDLPGAAS